MQRASWWVLLGLVCATAVGVAGAQQRATSPAWAERERLRLEFEANAAHIGFRGDGGPAEEQGWQRAREIACRWSLAVASLSATERRRIRVRASDEFDPRAGEDSALVGAAECADPLDLARVRHALGVDGWFAPLARADRAAAATFEASLPPGDQALLARLRGAEGDLRRLDATRPTELAELASELTGERCVHRPAALEHVWLGDEGAPSVTLPPSLSFLICEAQFIPDFGISYAVVEPVCDNVTLPRSVFLVHRSRGVYRVTTELAQAEVDSWGDYWRGEAITAAATARGTALFEVTTGTNEAPHHRDIAVCSTTSGACRWVEVATSASAPSYTLTNTALTIGSTTTALRSWLDSTDARFGRAERTRVFHAPFRWSQHEEDGRREEDTERCTFVVRDADGFLNVRAEPDQRSRVLGTIQTGTEIRAVWTTRSWLRIEQPRAGWIFRGATERRCPR